MITDPMGYIYMGHTTKLDWDKDSTIRVLVYYYYYILNTPSQMQDICSSVIFK
jgi:hypothetical protein